MYQLVTTASNVQPRFNICPTTSIDTVIDEGAGRMLTRMRWGIIPNWWSKPLKELRMASFNARAESVADKPMFRYAFKKTRCLIPVSGYYEWQTTSDGKQPFYFTRADGELMTAAGICDQWKSRESRETVKSAAMIITEPNEFVSDIHDRMPVILEKDSFETWMHGSPEDAGQLLKPARNDVLLKWPVSRRVNSSRTSDEDASLIEAVESVPAAAV